MSIPETTEPFRPQHNARGKIVDILTRVDTRQSYTDKLLEKEINDFIQEDRNLITEVVNGVLRWRSRLDWFLNELYVGEYDNLIPDVKNNLRASVYQLVYLDRVPPHAILNEAVEIAKSKYNQKTANLVNAILRNFLRQQKKLEYLEMQLDFVQRLCVNYSHPRWLVERWIELWGIDDTMALCEANNSRPRLSVRLNALLANESAFFEALDARNIPYKRHPDFPEFVWIDNFSEFRQLDFLRNGWVNVQDVSTGIPVRLLNPQPGDYILDMCAAPGGKCAFIGERMYGQGVLVALEKHAGRTQTLKENLQRMGIENAYIITADAEHLPLRQPFGKILLDAPCSGFGVLNKRVDLKWKRTMADVNEMQALQLRLLEVADSILIENGIIVYSTCTIETEENETVIERFLQAHPEYVLDDLRSEVADHYLWSNTSIRTFPHRHHIDGSFAVRLRKRPASDITESDSVGATSGDAQ